MCNILTRTGREEWVTSHGRYHFRCMRHMQRSSATEATGAVGYRPVVDHPVDETVGDCLRAREEAVALHVCVDALDLLAGVLGVDLVDAGAERQHLARVYLDVARLTFKSPGGLVDQDPAVRQRHALA